MTYSKNLLNSKHNFGNDERCIDCSYSLERNVELKNALETFCEELSDERFIKLSDKLKNFVRFDRLIKNEKDIVPIILGSNDEMCIDKLSKFGIRLVDISSTDKFDLSLSIK